MFHTCFLLVLAFIFCPSAIFFDLEGLCGRTVDPFPIGTLSAYFGEHQLPMLQYRGNPAGDQADNFVPRLVADSIAAIAVEWTN